MRCILCNYDISCLTKVLCGQRIRQILGNQIVIPLSNLLVYLLLFS